MSDKPTSNKISSVSELLAAMAYLNRIGAKVTSVYCAEVRDESGQYPRCLARIKFGATGQISIKLLADEDLDYETLKPNEFEEQSIKIAFQQADFCQIQPTTDAISLPAPLQEARERDKDLDYPLHYVEFKEINSRLYGDSTPRLVMIQERGETADGRKFYREWTYWTDGKWRVERPEQLPLWGLEQLSEHAVVFVHEGAKAAAFCRWLTRGCMESRRYLLDHPWGKSLDHAAHLGWVGGANMPELTDWAALKKAHVKKVYVVTDNDEAGKRVISVISKALRGIEVYWVKPDESFPIGFDLADQMPAGVGDYSDYVYPATWATQTVPFSKPPGRGRPPKPSYQLYDSFAGQWGCVIEGPAPMLVNKEKGTRYTERAFNAFIAAFSDANDVSSLMQKRAGAIFEGLAYRPGDSRREFNEAQRRKLNLWRGPTLQQVDGVNGNIWVEYLEHLIPNPVDRHEVCKWLATLVARPQTRMKYGLLLFSSTQGTGKSTLNTALRAVLGSWNCSQPQEADIVKSDFNGWIAEKQLVFVNEIYAGANWQAYTKLKEFVAEDTIRVNEKYMPGFEIENWAHFILCSNQSAGVALESQDRRFLVPRVTEELRCATKWHEFHEWLKNGGPYAIRLWAEAYIEQKGAVREADRAPMTARKQTLIEDSRTDEGRVLSELARAALNRASETQTPVALSVAQVRDFMRMKFKYSKIKPARVRDALVEGGLWVTDKYLNIHGRGGIKSLFCITDRQLVGISGGDIKEMVVDPQDILPDEM